MRVTVVGALLALGCAGDLVTLDGGYRHRDHGYAISAPDAPWRRRVHVERATLAYRRPGPATMSLQSRCGGPLASPALLSRHLMIGLRPRTLRQSGPTSVDGAAAWSQIFDTRAGETAVRVKTVTVVSGECVIDFVLVGTGRFDELEPDFDAWVASLRLPEDGRAGRSR